MPHRNPFLGYMLSESYIGQAQLTLSQRVPGILAQQRALRILMQRVRFRTNHLFDLRDGWYLLDPRDGNPACLIFAPEGGITIGQVNALWASSSTFARRLRWPDEAPANEIKSLPLAVRRRWYS